MLHISVIAKCYDFFYDITYMKIVCYNLVEFFSYFMMLLENLMDS